jgi:hypothetical protein
MRNMRLFMTYSRRGEMAEIKAGLTVRLKSGGPVMTVEQTGRKVYGGAAEPPPTGLEPVTSGVTATKPDD